MTTAEMLFSMIWDEQQIATGFRLLNRAQRVFSHLKRAAIGASVPM
jgi:hypothetical protein